MNGKWSKENFEQFDRENPDIFKTFAHFALIATRHRRYYSAKAVFHRVRWETMVSGKDDAYKIDDGWISHYARKFMICYPEHDGFFQTRSRRDSYHNVSRETLGRENETY